MILCETALTEVYRSIFKSWLIHRGRRGPLTTGAQRRLAERLGVASSSDWGRAVAALAARAEDAGNQPLAVWIRASRGPLTEMAESCSDCDLE